MTTDSEIMSLDADHQAIRADDVPLHDPLTGAAVHAEARRWPVAFALVTAGIRPATTAQRIGRVPLWKALLILVTSGVATVLIITLIVACQESRTLLSAAGVRVQLGITAEDVVREFREYPYHMIGAVVGITALIVAGSLLLALTLTSWGARDERVRDSLGNAVRQVWLHAPHIPMAVAMLGTVIVFMSHLDKSWRAANNPPSFPPWTTYVTVAPSDPQFKTQNQAFSVAIGEYSKARQLQPWYVRDGEIVPIALGFMLASWVLWGMLRGVGAPRDVKRIVRPPTCESCGYNLTSMEMNARCPECGIVVADSLGSDVRPGTDWQRRCAMGRRAAWWRCTMAAVSKPRVLGRQIQLTTGVSDHRSFVAPHLPLLFLIAAGAFSVMLVLTLPANARQNMGLDLHLFVGIAIIVGTLMPCLTILGQCVSALLVGGLLSHRYKRNLLGGAIQMSSYLSGYLVAWAAFGACTMVLTGYLDHASVFRALSDFVPIDSDVLLMLSVVIPNVPWVVYYLVLLSSGTTETRYARR